ncbi:MAG: L,D-transpeptidase family protein, partial [Ignavibacteriales bacterium]|nr:L,D-transpeptidase family protein [Ignavibacteriales bacterium]
MRSLVIFLTAAGVWSALTGLRIIGYERPSDPIEFPSNAFVGHYNPDLRDTLFTAKNAFVVIDIAEQMAYLHRRDQPTLPLKVSTGTPYIVDGMHTQEGVFVIQSKYEEWYSIQFDSARMTHFMPFNWGIGFHGLGSSSYYKYLGKRPSSHGCVRVARDDVKEMFEAMDIGAPVLVHEGMNNSVVVAFGDPSEETPGYSADELRSIIVKRMELIRQGKYYTECRERLYIDETNIDNVGLPIGDIKRVSVRQATEFFESPRSVAEPDILTVATAVDNVDLAPIEIAPAEMAPADSANDTAKDFTANEH